MNRRDLLAAFGASLALPGAGRAVTPPRDEGAGEGAKDAKGAKGVMLMNRIGPSASTLHVVDRDGSGERPLLPSSALDYHASFSADGASIVFTSDRGGDGQSDVFRVRADGTGVRALVATPSMGDAGVLSPDGSRLAYGQIFSMNAYGTDKRILIDSLWEGAMPLFVPADAA